MRRRRTSDQESLVDHVERLSGILEEQRQELDEQRRRLQNLEAENFRPPLTGERQGRGDVEAHRSKRSRRELLRLAGAAVAGAAGSVALQTIPASAANGGTMMLGQQNDANATTQLHPTGLTPSTPLFQIDVSSATNIAVGLGVVGASNANAVSAQAGGGTTANAIAGTAGVGSNSNGVVGTAGGGANSSGVVGNAGPGLNSFGVAGNAGTGNLSAGVSGSAIAIGTSPSAAGVVGQTTNAFGVVGQATTGIDIAASGNGRLAQVPFQIGGSGAPSLTPSNGLLEIVREDDGSVWASRAQAGNPIGMNQVTWKRLNAVRVDASDGSGNPFVATRILDTRNGTGTGTHTGPLLPSQVWDFGPYNNTNGIPVDAIGLIGNLTAVASDANGNVVYSFPILGWLALTPGGINPANPVSSVNYGGPVQAVANFFVVGFGTGANFAGKLRIQNGGGTKVHVLIDVFGYLQ